MRYRIIALAMVLCGFALPSNVSASEGGDRKNDLSGLPFDGSNGFLDGYSLRVSRDGDFLWNGAPVNQVMLKTYLRQWAALPHSAGRLFVAFEPGTSQFRVGWVKRQVVASGLCNQRHCAEVGWNVKRQVVN